MEGIFFVLFILWVVFVLARMLMRGGNMASTFMDSLPDYDSDDYWWRGERPGSHERRESSSTESSSRFQFGNAWNTPSARPHHRSHTTSTGRFGSAAHRPSTRSSTRSRAKRYNSTNIRSNGGFGGTSRKSQTRATMRKTSGTARTRRPSCHRSASKIAR